WEYMSTTADKPFDIQVNGYGGIDFNSDDVSAHALEIACKRLEADGVGGILATIITDTLERMTARLAAIVRGREQSEITRRMIGGIHIDGPFLSPVQGYRGAH